MFVCLLVYLFIYFLHAPLSSRENASLPHVAKQLKRAIVSGEDARVGGEAG